MFEDEASDDADIPEDSIVDTESSDGRGFAEFDASDQDDEDYVINVEELSEHSAESELDVVVKKPAKKERKEVRQYALLHQYTHKWSFLRRPNEENSAKQSTILDKSLLHLASKSSAQNAKNQLMPNGREFHFVKMSFCWHSFTS